MLAKCLWNVTPSNARMRRVSREGGEWNEDELLLLGLLGGGSAAFCVDGRGEEGDREGERDGKIVGH